ncbi:bifunctional (p)ppGpp synthetase/guanosine-3',5'-bis(diphosphate) 3'-pyrophosphohydrolase [Patescibacteria group bacterium]|nr:bifunctional (p)ppGpp synthetase/guanosine-3',5'-bis(diphosphate) 3'-pyrophosphohydrolase [Patescibacteria group bacterium]MBU1934450.1 bifunctional (p)ppGpp synthetase/guanosine-3',5'-bis(diphosphate) 3'-pyrophosphohydrolase [Patescibacteria group bacterium]
MSKKANISDIIKGAKKYLPNINEERVKRAYEFAKKAHAGVKRASGDSYIQHPLEVTKILLDLKPDEDSIVASLLHDVLEDTGITAEDLRKQFNDNVIPLLKGMEKLGTVYYRGRERQVENLRKMFLAMSHDIRVILIKLADRLHNMRTLGYIPEIKRKRIAEETLTIYSPIAARLGIYRIKNELDDLAFKHLFPDDYKRIYDELHETTGKQKNIINKSKAILLKTLKENGIKAEIEGRIKHLYSIHKKLKRKNKNYISELYDILALRIVVEDESQCYQTLGIIHKNWTPLARRFKDYIANAKDNGYQSLHTTLIGLCSKLHNQPIEVQIRTHDMNLVAKYGVAAHWQYKEKGGYSIAIPEEKLKWIQNLVNVHENLKNNAEFIESLNVDIFHDRIFVLTPKGDVLDLPKDATPIDFAYGIHTDLGHKCKGAKVNGKIVPLDDKLKNGEVIEILTSNIAQPNRYWLSFVMTAHAKNRIKQWFNSQDRDQLIKMGKDLVNKHLKRFNQPLLDPDLSVLKKYSEKRISVREREELLENIGNGSVDVMSVIKKILPESTTMKETSKKVLAHEVLTEGVKLEDAEVLITGEKGYKTQIATCCMPTPNDEIVGYVTRGRGVTIHKKNCKVLIRGHGDARLIRASWSTKTESKYEVKLSLKRQSRIGMLRDMADVFATLQLPILDIQNIRHKDSDIGETIITSSLDNIETLNKVIHKLESIPGIFSVKEID